MATSFEVLNDILNREHLSIERYQLYIDSLPSSPLRNQLTAILTDHKEHAQRLSYFIQTNGGHVEEGTGLAGKIAFWKIKMDALWENKPLKMLDKLYTEEDEDLAKGLQLSEKYLSAAEKEIMGPIIADEYEHLRQLLRVREDLLQ